MDSYDKLIRFCQTKLNAKIIIQVDDYDYEKFIDYKTIFEKIKHFH